MCCARRRRVRHPAAILCLPAALLAPAASVAAERSGREIYESTCITCHGVKGRGADIELAKVIPLPDFSDCGFAAREPDADWLAVAHRGGPARGFSPLMRAWEGEFTASELKLAVAHLRTFCTDESWPRGELNLPRPLVTGKAYPEDEVVLSTSATTADDGRLVSKFIYERRIGPLNQVEISIPVAASERVSGSWSAGVGDMALGYKRSLAHNLRRGSIVSASGEVVLPTGSETRGLGGGVGVLEPFVTFGQLLPRDAFVQAQAGFEIPLSTGHDTEAFWRAAIGQSYQEGGFGRTWSPMLEILAARPVASQAATSWDIVPQVQVTLSARQHVRINGGVRMPVTDRANRSATVIVYLLWDWFDGSLFAG